MRKGASVSQLLHESVLPRGAWMKRVLSRRLGEVMAEAASLYPRENPLPLAPGVASPRLPRQRGPLVPARAGEGRVRVDAAPVTPMVETRREALTLTLSRKRERG